MITKDALTRYAEKFSREPAMQTAMNAVTRAGVDKTIVNPVLQKRVTREFSLNIKGQGEITNQKSSGRCWMFAALNTMRFEIIKKLNLESFELSQNYPLFFDKLEKSNTFLDSILETLDEPVSGRLVSFLLSSPLGDGGQWDMFCALVDKYGIVPKSEMPETISSSKTGDMVHYLTLKLRQYACELRTSHEGGATMQELNARKDGMLSEIYGMLCVCLGKPPEKFDFECRDKDDKFIRRAGITPLEFYHEYVGWNLNDYVSLINAPTADKPYDRTYTVRFLASVREGRQVKYLNLTSEELKKAAIAQMQAGEPVWFGSDVGKCLVRDEGIMDTVSFQPEAIFGTAFPMNKAQRLDYGESVMTHAMVFQGVNLDENGKPTRWRVENSWGKDAGKDGYYVMSDEWFDEYTYQVVVNKKYLTDKQRALLDLEPIVLEPWDPMGSLA